MDYLEIRELYHDGIKGMKWGIRRYQNYDGTLTAEGKLRYNKGAKEIKDELEKEGKEFKAYKGSDGNYYYKDKEGKEQLFKTRADQLSDAELIDLNRRVKQENELHKETSNAYEYNGPKEDQALRDASRLANDIANAIPKTPGKTIKKDYSNLSDQELRNRIQRLQLEDSYGKLSGDTKYVKSGSERAREILQTAGALLAVAGSAAALALTIKQLREKPQHMGQSDILEEDEDSLMHYGVQGQKWGVRRYQNPDGSLTLEGQARYGGKTHIDQLSDSERADLIAENRRADEEEKAEKTKKALKIGGIVVGAAVVAAGAAFIASKLSKEKTNREINETINIRKTEISEKRKNTLIENKKFKQEWEMKWGMPYPGKNSAKGIENLIIQNGNNNIAGIISKSLLHHSDILDENYLEHHGVKGQKWGVRRYQDESGALTSEGRKRYRTDKGTQEILDNSSRYDNLTKAQRKEYAQYGRTSGAKKGFLIGLAGGALVGLDKTAADIILKSNSDGKIPYTSARSMANSFTRNMMLGALGGSVVGTLVGSIAGKKSAQAKLADRGREYVDELLRTPTDRIRGR